MIDICSATAVNEHNLSSVRLELLFAMMRLEWWCGWSSHHDRSHDFDIAPCAGSAREWLTAKRPVYRWANFWVNLSGPFAGEARAVARVAGGNAVARCTLAPGIAARWDKSLSGPVASH